MTKFKKNILTILHKLQERCDIAEAYEPDTKKGIPYCIKDMFPHLDGQEDLRATVQYLRKNGLNISITLDIERNSEEVVQNDGYQDEDSVVVGIIKGKNIEAIKKVIENNIKKLNPQMEVQSSQGMVGSPNIKEAKQKFTSKLKIVGGCLYFGDEKIPTERGQKTMTQLFLDNAKIFRGEKKASNGHTLSAGEIQQAGNYINEYAFRNGLNKLRRKLKKAKWPVTIENPGTKMYQMEIKYNKINKTQK